MFKRVPVETKREVLEKVKSGMTVAQVVTTYAISSKTIYTWLSNETRPQISVLEVNRIRRENEELKRIIGLVTLELERGKKIKIIAKSNNKKLVANCMGINRKNIYHKSQKDIKDQPLKSDIENTFLLHPAYGHRRLALELKINHKRILRIMHKYGLKPPRLWYKKKFTACPDPNRLVNCTNLLKIMDLTAIKIADV